MKPHGRTGTQTFDDLCERVREDQKADLIDGVIYMASPDREVRPRDGFVLSSVLPGFRFKAEWSWKHWELEIEDILALIVN